MEKQIVVFKTTGGEYGLDISSVREIVKFKTPVPIPGAAQHMKGIINLRGETIPVVDVGMVFSGNGLLLKKKENTETDETEGKMIVVTSNDGRGVALLVESVSEILRIQSEDVDSADSVIGKADYVSGVVKKGGRLVVAVDTEALLSEIDSPAKKRGKSTRENMAKQTSAEEKTAPCPTGPKNADRENEAATEPALKRRSPEKTLGLKR